MSTTITTSKGTRTLPQTHSPRSGKMHPSAAVEAAVAGTKAAKAVVEAVITEAEHAVAEAPSMGETDVDMPAKKTGAAKREEKGLPPILKRKVAVKATKVPAPTKATYRSEAAAVLAQHGPLHLAVLWDAVVERGLLDTSGALTPIATCSAVMLRAPEFTRVGRGTWALAEAAEVTS